MSDRFEARLADWFRDELEANPPQGGQKLLAEFHDVETADAFADSLVKMADEDAYPVQGDEDHTLPAMLPEGGVPTYLTRVKEDVGENPDPHEITQGYATRMRNLISNSVQTDEPRAFLMILESDATLDTLEASEQLFGDEGILDLEDFRQTILDPSTCDTKPGKALLGALDSVLEENSVYTADVSVLDTLVQIRDAIDNRDAETLPSLIADLPEFIQEDYISEDWFSQKEDQDTIQESAEKFLEENRSHAAQLRRAHQTGTDTESKLRSTYEEEFVRKVLDAPTWKDLKHTESEKYKQEVTKRQFRKLEVTATDHRIYSPTEADETRRSVIGLPDEGTIKLTAEFSADLEETPFEFIGPDGDDVGSLSKYENRVTATLDDIPTGEPTFARFNFYVGKKTTSGKPTHQFDLAAVPRWFYDATDDVTLDIDVDEEEFIRHGDDEIRLVPPQRLDFDYQQSEKEVELTGSTDRTIEFTEPLLINPSPPETVERVGFLLAPPDEIPINIVFLTEVSTAETEEIVFPLMLAAISDPNRWAVDDLKLPESLSIDTDRGEIYTATEEGIRIEEEALELVQIEEEIVREGVPYQRTVDSDEHGAGTVVESDQIEYAPLQEAYSNLFDHFNDRNRTPSTDPWDSKTQQLVADVLDAYQGAIEAVGEQPSFEEYEPLRGLGMIHSTTTDKTWLTPFHPVKLAYALRIAHWRDETLCENGHTGGFRSERFTEKFNSSGLLPYIVPSDGNDMLLRGIQYGRNSLWSVHSPVDSPGSVTPEYMERVVRDKLDTFVKSFPMLFKLHASRTLEINLINQGDLRPVVKGLYEFYKRIEKGPFEPPQILLRIYGGPSEGEALDRFFGENRKSRLRTQLEKKNDEIVDLLRSNVMYVMRDEYTSESHEEAHLTFFRGLLTEEPGLTEVDDLQSSLHLGGLLPQESINVREGQSGTVYSVGFGYDGSGGDIGEVARLANTLEAGKKNGNYLPDHILKKTIKSSHKANLRELWDDSLWVVHVQPNVDLDFYTESRSEIGSDDGMVMIHYSDQYDSSSPNYDVITSTTKRQPYLTALRRTLSDGEIVDHLNPERVLSTLIAVDGEIALELQRGNDTSIVEKVGFAGGLALSRRLLQQSFDEEYAWIPLSLNELARHDRSTRGSGPGLLQYEDYNPASDDLCMVGVPTDPRRRDLKLWIVETKGGTSSIKKGREQVQGALTELQSIFHPDVNYSDHDLLYSEFGKIVIDVARRMHSYDVLTDEEIDVISEASESLREGEFDVSFLTDANGHVGEVIRVRSGDLRTNLGLSESVRSIEVPLKVMNLLEDDDIEATLPDLNLKHLEFDIDSKASTGGVTTPRQGMESAGSGQQIQSTSSENQDNQAPGGVGDESPGSESIETTRPSDTRTDPAETQEAETNPKNPQENTDQQQVETETKASENTADSDGESTETASIEDTMSLDSGKSVASNEKSAHKSERRSENSEKQSDSIQEPTESHSVSDSEAATKTGEETSTESESEQPTAEVESTVSSSMVDRVLEQMETSPEPDTSVDRSKLVSDLKREFESLGVEIHPPNPSTISIGPRKIGVNVHPKEGQTVEEIMRKLNSLSVHIQAGGQIVGQPIPSKGAVRLEIPHNDPTDVMLREGLEALGSDLDSPVTIPLGIDTENTHHALSMLEEKHALVGGATGSGKSNFLSTIATSLAILNDPDEVKLSILDPKGVDFGRFESLPHVRRGTYLDTPEECTSYLLDLLRDDLPDRKARLKESGFTSVSELNEYADEMGHEQMPYHVIIIDEFADLIMSLSDGKDEFEDAVTRLAQVGRAHGYVIFLATQRPSADIVSGKIKANFPCRISFRLPSNTDSRVILDKPGAEDLQGAGDMIALTQDGQLNLQGYRLTPKDAIAVRDALSEEGLNE